MFDDLFGEEAPKRNGKEIRAALEKAASGNLAVSSTYDTPELD